MDFDAGSESGVMAGRITLQHFSSQPSALSHQSIAWETPSCDELFTSRLLSLSADCYRLIVPTARFAILLIF